MTMTPQEAAEIKVNTLSALKAIEQQADVQSKLLESMNSLTIEIREDRAKKEAYEEARADKDRRVQEQIGENKKAIEYIYSTYKAPIERVIISQGRWDKMINSIFSGAGKTMLTILLLSLAVLVSYSLGLDPSNLKAV